MIDPAAEIHPAAIIGDGAIIGPGCRIGPYCVIGPDVRLGASVELKSHVAIDGVTRIGDGTVIYPFASLGHAPQDLKYAGERTELVIGARNKIREYVTMNPGTEGGGGVTRIGDDNLFMVSTHIGHDCQIGNNVVMANSIAMAGHAIVGDNVIIGGLSGVHQFCRIGKGAMIGGMSPVVADVIPYGTVMGERAHLVGLNLVGLKRRGAAKADINGLRAAYAELFGEGGTLAERAARLEAAYPGNPLVQDVAAFITAQTSRHFTTPE